MLKIGDTSVSNIVFGNTEYNKMCLGSDVIWERPAADNDTRILYLMQNSDEDVRFNLHVWNEYEFIMSFRSVNSSYNPEYWLSYWENDSESDINIRKGSFRALDMTSQYLFDHLAWNYRASVNVSSLPLGEDRYMWYKLTDPNTNTFTAAVGNLDYEFTGTATVYYHSYHRSLGLFDGYGRGADHQVFSGGRFYYLRVKSPTYDYIPVLHEGVPCLKTVNYTTGETVEYLYSVGGRPSYPVLPVDPTPPYWNEITQFAS